ncbi:MraY family glycosyltransferase [uncultured Microbacterium sp.]|uniref:MraY family glycosyltransferase n=1 Tax=uncultured Microbacterium sp. TaxID=191216 RepID=UPI0025D2CE1E|nr:MraY family glycosyltransferase [uncultured Microbacterium sp.]
MKQYLFVFLLTALFTLALSWVVWQLSLRFKLYPGIRERDVHKTPTPRLGGIAMFISIMVVMALSRYNEFFAPFWSQPQQVYAIMAASLLIVLVGVADDLWDLDWMIKLGAQFVAAGLVAWWGQLQIFALPIGGMTIVSGWLSFALTVFSIVIVMNAVNFIDGLDGLVAGVCLIANGVFFAYSYLLLRDFATSNFSLATFLAAVMAGACAGFLVMNWNPAKLFMGDAGALLLGLLMATSAIAITGALEPTVLDPDELGRSQLLGAFIPIILPIVVVLLPLLDFSLAVIRRMSAGKSPFSPDRKHLHHRMLDMGHSDRDAVLVFYAWTAVAGIGVLLMFLLAPAYWIGVVFALVGAAACIVLTILPSRGKRRSTPPPPGSDEVLTPIEELP